MDVMEKSSMRPCKRCNGQIFWTDCSHGGYWTHLIHPDDGHDAHPLIDPITL